MIDIDKIRAEFERRFPVPAGIEWDAGAGDYAVTCKGCWTAAEEVVHQARWESWQACRQSIRVANPFELIIGDPDGQWAHDVAEKSLRAQGFKVAQ